MVQWLTQIFFFFENLKSSSESSLKRSIERSCWSWSPRPWLRIENDYLRILTQYQMNILLNSWVHFLTIVWQSIWILLFLRLFWNLLSAYKIRVSLELEVYHIESQYACTSISRIFPSLQALLEHLESLAPKATKLHLTVGFNSILNPLVNEFMWNNLCWFAMIFLVYIAE